MMENQKVRVSSRVSSCKYELRDEPYLRGNVGSITETQGVMIWMWLTPQFDMLEGQSQVWVKMLKLVSGGPSGRHLGQDITIFGRD